MPRWAMFGIVEISTLTRFWAQLFCWRLCAAIRRLGRKIVLKFFFRALGYSPTHLIYPRHLIPPPCLATRLINTYVYTYIYIINMSCSTTHTNRIDHCASSFTSSHHESADGTPGREPGKHAHTYLFQWVSKLPSGTLLGTLGSAVRLQPAIMPQN